MRKNASFAWPSNSIKRSIFFNRDFSYPGGGIPGLEVKNYTPPLKILKRHPWLENGPLLPCGGYVDLNANYRSFVTFLNSTYYFAKNPQFSAIYM